MHPNVRKKYTIYKETEADQGNRRQGIPNNHTIWVIPYTPDPGVL